MSDHDGQQLIYAAQRGDQRALDELIASYLPLIYNIVGRALQGHADVDDVVQETMLKIVNGVSGLRDPAAFRSWAVSIAMNQIRDSRRRGPRVYDGGLEELQGVADPGADFVDLTILRLGLTDQRRETAEATRWLEEADRDLLALWWLEAAGQITRGELADALELTPAYAAVRVQRMKAQLETARALVRAIWATPRCDLLSAEMRDWDGRPSPLWRKRLARHLRDCSECSMYGRQLVPAESLLAGIALVPLPVGGVHLAAHRNPADSGEASGGSPRPPQRSVRNARNAGGARTRLLTGKPLIASVIVTAVCAGCAIAMTGKGSPASSNSPQAADAVTGVTATSPASSSAGPTTAPTPSTKATTPSASPHRTLGTPTTSATRPSPRPAHSSTPAATPTPPPPTTPTAPIVMSPFYGQTVDTVDTAPDRLTKPGPLPKRPETAPITGTGNYSQPFQGSLGGKYLMFWSGQNVTITGTGYFRVRYEIAWFNRVGQMVMPTWTGLRGQLFHVASGGGRRMDDHGAGQPADTTWMGNPKAGYITLPAGAQQMWNNEYFYLDGTVTLHENEGYADYNISVNPSSWTDVTQDIDAAPDGKGIIRYGLVRDTGTDATPVPQYLTRSTPANAASVPQQSEVATETGH